MALNGQDCIVIKRLVLLEQILSDQNELAYDYCVARRLAVFVLVQ